MLRCDRVLVDHRAHDLAAGRVAQRVDDPGVRMAPFAAQGDVAVDLVEVRAPVDQLADPAGASRTTISTTSGSQSPLPAASVSAMWSSNRSSGSSTPAIPPWA